MSYDKLDDIGSNLLLSEEQFNKHPHFYLEDGSIILIVQQTQFRIHKSVLARQSDVFKSMFSLQQPEDTPALLDGCDYVVLEGDSADDMENVLQTLYDPFHFDNIKGVDDLQTVLNFLAGILRISTKYDMQHIRRKCISILLQRFPTTLSGCDRVLGSHYRYKPGYIAHAVQLGHETNVRSILPWAYYICAHVGIDDLMQDPILTWRDKALCLAGREKLWEAQKTMTHCFLFNIARSDGCTGLCSARSPQTITWKDVEGLRKPPHPLDIYTAWTNLGLCSVCRVNVETQHRVGREKLWEQLPGIFGLGMWKELLAEVENV